MRQVKSDQLRVRLTREARAALEEYARKQGADATISSVLREFIQWLLNPESQRRPRSVSPAADEALREIARDWGRSEEHALDACVLAIKEMIDGAKSSMPLIVKEVRLRRSYRPKKGAVTSA